MMFKIIIPFLLNLILITTLFSQSSEIYMPRDIKYAYDSGTRSYDGKSPKNYWQNKSDYKIFAEVIPETRTLNGIENVTYYNNSPDKLDKIVIRLYHDIYKKGNARDWQMNPAAINDGMIINKLKVNGENINLKDNPKVFHAGTNMIIKLENPLESKNSIELEIAWSFIIPDESKLRMGAYDESSFFVAYWYPQIAVYDDIDGWDLFNYGGTLEFYNDFANFDVEITLPEGFIVWATGVLQNPQEVLKPEIYDRYKLAQTADTIINVVSVQDYKSGIVTTPDAGTFRYVANYVSDFTFALSDHYLWDLTSLVVDETTGRRTVAGAAYNKESEDFYDVANISRESIKFFSEEMPGIAFPYPELTVFNGSGGMESPMMVNDGSFDSEQATVGVTSHEISHTYFPFYMGTNERKYAFMDEGWAVMLPLDFQARVDSNNVIERNMDNYATVAGIENEIPLLVPSSQLRSAYRRSAYSRPCAAYYILKETLGEKDFKKCLHEYINRWNGKHPIPYDFYFTFNETYGESLDWFWKPWFFEPGYPDLAIKDANVDGENVNITIKKLGNVPIPIYIKIVIDNDEDIILKESAFIWKDGKTEVTFNEKVNGKVTSIILGNSKIPDSELENNSIEF